MTRVVVDEMDPCQILPKEMWEEILNRIEDDLDKFNFLQSHFDFKILFEKEYEKLRDGFGLQGLLDYFEKTMKFCSNAKLIEERRQSVLACRLVSRNWCSAIDNWMDTFWSKITQVENPCILKNNPNFSTDLATGSGLRKFTKHFGEELLAKGIKIFSRNISISIPLYDIHDDYPPYPSLEQENGENEKIKKTLTKVGANIIGLKIHFSLNMPLRNRAVEQLRIESFKSALELVPNVKYLIASWQPSTYLDVEGEDQGMFDFPELPQLIDLSIFPEERAYNDRDDDDDYDEDKDIIDYLFPFERYFHQLKNLHLNVFDCWKDEYSVAGKFPKLRHLWLNEVVVSDRDERKNLFGICKNLFAPNLETLNISLFGYDWDDGNTEAIAKRYLEKLLIMLNKTFEKKNVHWEGIWIEDDPYQLKFKRTK